jgi:nicotinate-nucleotide pyrophosphorylase (carboxylating)
MRVATRQALRATGLEPREIEALCQSAVAEDLDGGVDVTSAATIDATAMSTAEFVVRGTGVFAGAPVLACMLETHLGDNVELTTLVADGTAVTRSVVLARVVAPTRALLTVERSALNLVCRLSGVATATHRWVEALAGTSVRVRDTRKTTPGLRDLEKYAVRCGGGVNHRRGLHDAILIKDNHVLAAGGVGKALDAVWRRYPDARKPGGRLVVQTEIDRLSQLDEAIAHGAHQILLDNMSTDDMAEAVRQVRARAPHILIEASGGLTLERAPEVAATGVDFIAVGAITHSSPILDIALDFRA